MPGVLESVPRSAARRRRASAPAIVTIGRRDVFVKHGDPASLLREATVLRHLERHCAGATPLAPAALACDIPGGRLYTVALPGWQTLHERFDIGAGDDRADACLLGARLAALHALDPAGLSGAADHVPCLDVTPLQAIELCGETLAMIGWLQGVEGLHDRLVELRAGAAEPVVVHGDLKLDNVLRGCGDRLAFVDFEHGGTGDAAWDVGSVVGDYLSRWLLSSRPNANARLTAWLRDAAVPLARCGAATRALLAGYETRRPLPDRDRIAAHAGVFLLHRAQAWIERYGRFGAKASLLARCGSGLIRGRARALAPLLEAA